MTTRIEGGVTYAQTLNGENRLVSVTAGGQTTAFTYDGDGQRVKKVDAGGTTYYVGGYYEVKSGVVTKYYYLGGQRVAMRANGVLYYLNGDHLGSTSLTTRQDQTVYAEQRYYPYGEQRWSSGTLPTDYRFTGQREEGGIKLYDYRARFYSPYLGRFVSADTIVPGVGSMSLNRYMYVAGNPIRYNDPDGHCGPFCWIGIGMGLTGLALLVTADTPLPPEVAPPDEQGILGGILLLGAPVVAEAGPAFLTWLSSIVCGDGDCTNEAQAGMEAGKRALEAASADGDPTNEVKTTASVVDKLQRYLLNPDHPVGKSKAQWFDQALGYTKANLQQLADQIVFDPSTAYVTEVTEYGTKYNQVITITGANGKEIDVVFAWIRNLDGVVRLVTSIPTER